MKHLLLFISIFGAQLCTAQQKANSVTRTFPFMEEEIQKTSIIQSYRGSGFIADVKSEYSATPRGDEYTRKLEKLQLVLNKMDSVEITTKAMLRYIDHLKMKLIAGANEDTVNVIESVNDDSRPYRLNLYKLKNPTYKITIQDSIGLFRKLNQFRDKILHLTGDYDWGTHSYRIGEIRSVRNYSSQSDLKNQVHEIFNITTYNYRDDKYLLIDIYFQMHNAALKVVNERSKSLLTNLCLLSVLQQNVLASRTLALAHWKSKVSTGEYSFNKLVTIVNGPEIIKAGESPQYTVFFAALSTDQVPEINVDSPPNAKMTYNQDGTYTLILEGVQSGTIQLEGSLTIRNKSGIERTEQWKKTIEAKP